MNQPRLFQPPAYFYAALVLMVGLRFLPLLPELEAFPWNMLGAPPLIAGLGLVLWARRLFKERATTMQPGEKSSVLITDGPYAWSRHPMYLGMTLTLGGLAVILGEILPWVPVVAFAVCMDRIFITSEEEEMETTFGEEYHEYANRVRRWI